MEQIETFFWVETKDRRIVPFQLNNKQWQLVEALDQAAAPIRLVLLKGRQFGMSTFILALYALKCLIIPNTRAVVIAHDQESTKRLFRKVKFFFDHLIAPPTLEKESERRYTFPMTNSSFYIGTAGQRSFGRGDNITDLHCSEIAFWPDVATVMNGLLQAVGKTGQAVIETTANGIGDYFHQLWENSQTGSAWQPLFLSWVDFDEYEMPVLADFIRTPEEQRLCEREPGLTDRKLAWRRWKISELLPELGLTPAQIFRREYPLTATEAFLASGRMIFDADALRSYQTIPGEAALIANGTRQTWQPPSGYSVMGIDVAEGVTLTSGGESQGDGHAIEIYDAKLRQAVEWRGFCDIDQLGELAVNLANLYKSYVGFEINNQGIALAQYLKKHFPLWRLFHREVYDENYKLTTKKLGWHTNSRTKPLMLAQLAAEIRERRVEINSQPLVSECLQTTRDDDGIVNTQGKDRLMATAIALQMYQHRPPPVKPHRPEQEERQRQETAWRQKRRKRQRSAVQRLLYG